VVKKTRHSHVQGNTKTEPITASQVTWAQNLVNNKNAGKVAFKEIMDDQAVPK